MSKISKRDSIAKAALELFSTNGYTNTTTKLIADKAEVNEVTIFRHFGSKESLFQEVTKNYVERLDFMEKISAYKKLTPDVAIERIGNDFINYCYDNEQIYKIQMKMQDDILSDSKLRLSKSYIAGLKIYLTSLKDDGVIKNNPEILANNFILSILGVFTFYVLTNDFSKEQVDELIQHQIKNFIIHNGL